MSMCGRARSQNGGLDAIIVTASGCGTTIKDYGFMLRLDPAYAEKAARISALARDVTEYLAALDLPAPAATPGSRGRLSFRLLDAARPEDHAPAEGAACQGGLCRQGAARGASVLRLGRHLQHHAARDRQCNCATARCKNIAATGADIVATGNIGCMTQIAGRAGMPIVHTVELLDWAYGGPKPTGL